MRIIAGLRVLTDLSLNHAVLRAGDEDKTFDLKEVGELRGIELPDADCVALFVRLR